MSHAIQTELQEIRKIISQQQLALKEIFTLPEAALYSGLSKSYLYKKTSSRQIPFYKLEGKLIFFKKQELDQWLLSNKVPCLSELEPPLKPSKKQVHD